MDTYTIIVSDRINKKIEADGSVAQYYTIYAKGSGDNNFPKVERTYKDFKSLEIALSNNLRENDIDCPQLEATTSSFMDNSEWSNGSDKDTSNLNDKLNNIKKFCKAISADPAFHLDPFYEFFQIPKPETDIEGRPSEVDFDKVPRLSFKIDVSPNERTGWHEFEKQPNVDYCQYFRVSLIGIPTEREDNTENDKKMHHYYGFNIKSLVETDTLLSLEKRYNQFVELATKMKQSVQSRPPPLPSKLLIKDKSSLAKRGDMLEEWLTVVLNEKMFLCKDVFDFIGLDKGQIPAYSSYDINQQLLSHVKLVYTVVGHRNMKNLDDSFQVWEIKVEAIDNYTKDTLETYMVQRRFKEFDHLYNDLKNKFQKMTKSIPSLPNKLTYLNVLSSSNDQTSQRKSKLELFVRELAAYPNIYQSISFRKFFELNNHKIDLILSKSHHLDSKSVSKM